MADRDLNPRDTIIQAASDLIENQGYHATGMNEIVRESGAPKGSIYYYFPEGKDSITAEAVTHSGKVLADRIRNNIETGEGLAESLQKFLETIAYFIEISGFTSGGPLTIVASETATTNEPLNQVCREAYTGIIEAFQFKLKSSAISGEGSTRLAWMITSVIEGAIILSRTFHSSDPLRQAGANLAAMIRAEQLKANSESN
jgi:TetR/AcrR family transcriptional repressor of lmrAB and yxaGH operons